MDRRERVLQQIAFGYVLASSGRMRKMWNHEMIKLARETCGQLGIAYSDGACAHPFETKTGAAEVDLPPRMESAPVLDSTNARIRARV
jgi:hypothetical protein